MTAAARESETWGELGPAMRDLSEIQRRFVRHYIAEVAVRPHGAQTRAARKAGYRMTGPTLTKHAHDLLRDPLRSGKIIAAVRRRRKSQGHSIWPPRSRGGAVQCHS